MLELSYDPAKREKTLAERGLDFDDAALVFAGDVYEWADTRFAYGEERIICFGYLRERAVIVGYVQRGLCRHIFSMRKANEREKRQFERALGEERPRKV